MASYRKDATAPTGATPPGTIQGWLCRNGTVAIKGGALVITPDAEAATKARPFLTHNALELPGPVTTTLRGRAAQGGKGVLTWRTRTQPEFVPESTLTFDWPASVEWREVKANWPIDGRLIHLRSTPPRGGNGLEVQSIELRGRGTWQRVWPFDSPR